MKDMFMRIIIFKMFKRSISIYGEKNSGHEESGEKMYL